MTQSNNVEEVTLARIILVVGVGCGSLALQVQGLLASCI
ncbi:unnamed protein product [Acidithrix sp. C25]|nr:unnamed protein product [Acidithrix sp. C25]